MRRDKHVYRLKEGPIPTIESDRPIDPPLELMVLSYLSYSVRRARVKREGGTVSEYPPNLIRVKFTPLSSRPLRLVASFRPSTLHLSIK